LYVLKKLNVLVSQTGLSGFQPMRGVEIYSVEYSSSKPDASVSEIGESRISRSLDNLGKMVMDEPDDWRTLLIHYLENSGHIADRKSSSTIVEIQYLENPGTTKQL
jgi:hypothetical protein